MDYYGQNQTQEHALEAKRSLNAQYVRVYGWMFFGLLVTAITSLFVIETPLIYLVTNRITFLALIFIELGVVWSFSKRAFDMRYGAAAGAFLLYSVLNGITLSLIFFAYTLDSIVYVFGITSALFGFMSIYGMVTKDDLSSIRSMLFMGLIGVIIASVVNLLLQSPTLNWIISFAGVAVFLGLTAYDSQKIKGLHSAFAGTPKENNVAIVGALELYLDFINLFLYILRILGKKK